MDSATGGGGSSAGVPASTAGVTSAGGGGAAQAGSTSTGGAAGSATGGAAGHSVSSGGAGMTGGGFAGVGGASGAASSAGSAGSGGTPGPNPQCAELAAAYASALAEQVTCNAGAANQCGSSAEAAPGCDCHVFIQPKDPFAIEHLLNLQADWFDADCEDPQCPVDCSDSEHGSCSQSGQCVPG